MLKNTTSSHGGRRKPPYCVIIISCAVIDHPNEAWRELRFFLFPALSRQMITVPDRIIGKNQAADLQGLFPEKEAYVISLFSAACYRDCMIVCYN